LAPKNLRRPALLQIEAAATGAAILQRGDPPMLTIITLGVIAYLAARFFGKSRDKDQY